MGLAVLPARLKDEMAELADALVNGTDLRATETLASLSLIHILQADGIAVVDGRVDLKIYGI